MNSLQSLLESIYIDMRLDLHYGHSLSERMSNQSFEIEKELGEEHCDLIFERFLKTGDDYLYVGAKVRVKRFVPYSEVFNDPGDTYLDDDGSFSLAEGLEGEIVEIDVDPEFDYWDCTVAFHGGEMPVMCKVEWLKWGDDEEDE